mmetsp:Transcript_11481/g.17224  ORF Transcript_11481/g.17224 Transcript_11481/m.17224 type:complete len:410 (-) Transcript_11481:479-1708(-)
MLRKQQLSVEESSSDSGHHSSPSKAPRRFLRSVTNRSRQVPKPMLLMLITMLSIFLLWRNGLIFYILQDLPIPFKKANIKSVSDPQQKQKERKQQVVIIVSSPCSGFDMVEKDFMKWSKEFKIRPYTYALPDLSSELYSSRDAFRPFLNAIRTKTKSAPRGFDDHNRTEYKQAKSLIDEFHHGFNLQWMQNKDIVIGSDTFNYFRDHGIREKFVNVLVKLMPWNDSRFSLYGSNDRIKVVVLYRSSRSRHVYSMWKNSSSNEKFGEWILSKGYLNLDMFSTANEFSRYGAMVDVIDVDHVAEMKLSLSHFIACNSLHLDCSTAGVLEKLVNATATPTELPSVETNSGTHMGNQEKIEKILEKHECRFEFFRHKGVQFFPSSLFERFSHCDGTKIDTIELGKLIAEAAES